ncbi:MAG: enoyl-CoA hydratase-related protein [Methanomassiliicoccales archaeon]
MDNYKNLKVTQENGIITLIINRPQAMNALNEETLLEIEAVTKAIKATNEVKVVIITGAGEKAFVAGADIVYMQELSAMQGREFGMLGQRVFRGVESIQVPVIAAVNGFALGGGLELALACDFRIATENAKFGQPEVGLGITPGFGGTQRLPRLVGTGWAKQLIYSGDNIDATTALRIGLVNQVVATQELMPLVDKLAHRISQRAPRAVQYSKAAINEGLQCDIDRGCTIEADLFGLCFATQDQSEGMTAFLNKRAAEFCGN